MEDILLIYLANVIKGEDIMIIIITFLVFLFDILSKIVVINYLQLEESVKVINNFLYLTYVRNTGAAWSILSNNSYVVLGISLLIIVGIIWYIWKNKIDNRFEEVAYSLVLGGAIGNFINRLFYGYVIDFIDIKIFGYDYPIFNLADVFIVIGVILLIIYSWRNVNGNSSKR